MLRQLRLALKGLHDVTSAAFTLHCVVLCFAMCCVALLFRIFSFGVCVCGCVCLRCCVDCPVLLCLFRIVLMFFIKFSLFVLIHFVLFCSFALFLFRFLLPAQIVFLFFPRVRREPGESPTSDQLSAAHWAR